MTGDRLLSSGVSVPFSDAASLLSRNQAPGRAAARHRALTATIVVVGPPARLPEAAAALCEQADRLGVRGILISLGSNPNPPVEVDGCAIALSGMKPEYVDNAVAALRLSSLPTLVWWRGGPPQLLEDLVDLAERIVLDEDASPDATWKLAIDLFPRAAFSDLRWTRLTRWRALMAHFFDVSPVRNARTTFSRLRVCGADRPSAQLFAGWMEMSLSPAAPLEVTLGHGSDPAPIEEVQLISPSLELTLHLAGSHTCVEAAATGPAARAMSRIVSLGQQSLPTLLAQELRIRARDVAFESAVKSVLERGVAA